jgi:hypothetical protein
MVERDAGYWNITNVPRWPHMVAGFCFCEQAFFAIAQGNHPKEAIVKILEYKEMKPFFVRGEGDEP